MSVMTLRTFSGSSHGFRPRPGTSFRPSMPFSSNRDDQSETVLTLTPSSAATDCSLRPSARSRMIRARNASRCRVVADLTRRRRTVLSSGVSSMTETRRAIAVVWHVFAINTSCFRYGTLARRIFDQKSREIRGKIWGKIWGKIRGRSGGEEVDYVLNGFVGAVVGGFEFAGWLVSGVGPVVKAAVGEGCAEPFVKEQKEQRDLDAFWREPVGVARAVTL